MLTEILFLAKVYYCDAFVENKVQFCRETCTFKENAADLKDKWNESLILN